MLENVGIFHRICIGHNKVTSMVRSTLWAWLDLFLESKYELLPERLKPTHSVESVDLLDNNNGYAKQQVIMHLLKFL